MDWITQYCKEDIRYYLCHTDLTVKEVCTKHVRKCFGVSPSALKKRRMAEK